MSEDFQKPSIDDPEAVEAVRLKLADVVRAKALYWDLNGEFERMLIGGADCSDALNDFLHETIENIAVSVDDPDSAAQVVSTEDAAACISAAGLTR